MADRWEDDRPWLERLPVWVRFLIALVGIPILFLLFVLLDSWLRAFE